VNRDWNARAFQSDPGVVPPTLTRAQGRTIPTIVASGRHVDAVSAAGDRMYG